jgi:hypothetical protein
MSVSLRQLRPDAKYGRTQVDEAARFQELAIFPEDALIPVSVVALLWGETGQISTKTTERLCQRLADLSLLRGYDQQSQTIQLHDVTRHYLIDQATNEQGQAWQERLINGYKTKCGGEWNRLPDDGYVYQNLLWHMRGAGQQDKLEQLLFSYDWLNAKLQVTDVLSLISDFNLRRDITQQSKMGLFQRTLYWLGAKRQESNVRKPSNNYDSHQNRTQQSQLGLLQHALQMSTSVLARDKNQLASQLCGRLSGLEKTSWKPFIDAIHQHEQGYWLQAQVPNLSPPGMCQ